MAGCGEGKRRMVSIGMYDGVHSGHRYLIGYLRSEAARRCLDPAVVTFTGHPLDVVNPSLSPRLLSAFDERLKLIREAGVDVIALDFDAGLRAMTAREFMQMLHEDYSVDALVMGFNNRFGSDRKKGIAHYQAIGREIGVEVIEAPEYDRKEGVSSSAIRKYISEGNISEASEALGRPFRMSGTVVEGHQVGRTIDFPTANLSVDGRMIVPMPGVYAAVAITPDGVRRPAMMNIGQRPTVDTDKNAPLSIEVHIFDFFDTLYGQRLEIEPVAFIRREKRFENLQALQSQLQADAATARRLIAGER